MLRLITTLLRRQSVNGLSSITPQTSQFQRQKPQAMEAATCMQSGGIREGECKSHFDDNGAQHLTTPHTSIHTYTPTDASRQNTARNPLHVTYTTPIQRRSIGVPEAPKERDCRRLAKHPRSELAFPACLPLLLDGRYAQCRRHGRVSPAPRVQD